MNKKQQYSKAYYLKHKDDPAYKARIAANNKKYRERHKEQYNEYQKKYMRERYWNKKLDKYTKE